MKLGAVVLAGLLPALAARADQVFLREPEAARALFGDGVTYERKNLDLSDAELKQFEQLLRRRTDIRTYPYLVVSSGAQPPGNSGRLAGHVFLLDVIGQSLPITFAVGVKPDGTAQDIQVMVYRETHGAEIRDRRFRAQFSGKTLKQPLAVGKDVDAITGATISSNSAAYAMRKGLALEEILRRRGREAP
jgi:H+/Na+-translocating ferredoxin:NAD+ oxidoreductase subunit G